MAEGKQKFDAARLSQELAAIAAGMSNMPHCQDVLCQASQMLAQQAVVKAREDELVARVRNESGLQGATGEGWTALILEVTSAKPSEDSEADLRQVIRLLRAFDYSDDAIAVFLGLD